VKEGASDRDVFKRGGIVGAGAKVVGVVGDDCINIFRLGQRGRGGQGGSSQERDKDSRVLHFNGFTCVVHVKCDGRDGVESNRTLCC
jgi:hypothetical protein